MIKGKKLESLEPTLVKTLGLDKYREYLTKKKVVITEKKLA